MAQLLIRCKLVYHTLKRDLIETFANIVKNGIFGNPLIFVMPPMTEALFQALLTDFINKLSAHKAGGTAQLGPYKEAKKALMAALDTLAVYVNTVALGNPNTIILAGFTPTKSNLTPISAPLQPTGATLTRGGAGELLADCAVVSGADSYSTILTADEELPAWVTMNGLGQLIINDNEAAAGAAIAQAALRGIIDLNKNRKKTFINLTVGTTYYLYYWATNAGGVSPLSVVVSKKVVEG